ncbi:hypothetical protein IMZ48_14065, partial [Candidatus Bathyarchaeota archaeon]|nr:hypothetical protein [Candidatus Bathyarchaeota archaeon]
PDLDLGPQEEGAFDSLALWDRKTVQSEDIQASPFISLLRHDLPTNLDDLITQSFDPSCEPNQHADPQVSDFMAAAKFLNGMPGFDSELPQAELHGKIAQALRNFHTGGPSRFPHTANYDVVYRNVLTVVLTYLPIPQDHIPSEKSEGERVTMKGFKPTYIEDAASAEALYFRFYTLTREFYAGDGDGGPKLGARYLRDIRFGEEDSDGESSDGGFSNAASGDEEPSGALRVAVDSLCGLEFTRDDAVGVARVRVKNAGGWKTAFEREGVADWDDDSRFSRTKATWPAGADEGGFFIIADVGYTPYSLV